ncbi:MAG: hypothetical protein A2Z14_13065 [Chloroflexi bacterium RBG_16_48_8]|nr:MAG: hypothetical protein A2Z14_13065 [Chloroflexi bacterium RBG_16_48_8]
MTWVPLLLSDPSPCFRLLVLRDLLHRQEDDPERQELITLQDIDPLVTELLQNQNPDGSWKRIGINDNAPGGALQVTAQALTRLGYLRFSSDHPAVRQAADFIFSLQKPDGSWPQPKDFQEKEEDWGYDMMPVQAAFPLRGLASCGYAQDPRSEKAYQWLLDQRLEDGAWPTGMASGNFGYVAGYRKLAHSRWGCRSNTTAALICLALHPQRRSEPAARRALDLLLGRETREKQNIGFEVARTMGIEPARGWTTFFARFDLALVLDLCWRVGASLQDPRVKDLVDFILELQGPYGLWEYERRPQASRWVTFDLLRSLSQLDQSSDWLSLEPRTPFQAYKRLDKRF